MEIWIQRPKWLNNCFIIFGAFIMAIAVKEVFDAMGIVNGGLTGIGIMVKRLTGNIVPGMKEGIPLWLTNGVLNIPLFICAFYIKGRHFVYRSLLGSFSLTFFLLVLPEINILTEDNLLNTILGGGLMGIGLGFVFSAAASTGGTDILAILINTRYRHISNAVLLSLIDGVIVLAGAVAFGIDKAMYAIISIIIMTKITDSMLDGLNFSKLALIISDKPEIISEYVMSNFNRGVTKIDIVGMYTKKQKGMLMCVVSKKEIVELKEIVLKFDKNAFVIVSDVREAVGEGFIKYRTNSQ